MLYALADDDASSKRLRQLLVDDGGSARPLTDDAEVAEALGLLVGSRGMAQANATLRGYADEAGQVLGALPDGPAHAAFTSLVDYTIARTG